MVEVSFLFLDPPRSNGSRFDDHPTDLKVLLFQLHLTKNNRQIYSDSKRYDYPSRNSSEAESRIGGKQAPQKRQLLGGIEL